MIGLKIIQPPQDLVEILLPAYGRCTSMRGECHECVKWSPREGYVPRGFRGATGRLDEIKLVLVCAEPGDPYSDERYDRLTPLEKLGKAYTYASCHLAIPRDTFGRNILAILNIAFPTLDVAEQMRRTWITESVLCSAEKEGGRVPRKVENECGGKFLLNQLLLFQERKARIVALGGKAQRRIRRLKEPKIEYECAYSAAPPGGNYLEARPSWIRALKGLTP